MTQIELFVDHLSRNLEMLKMTLGDFSDADMLVRPCPGANHAAWQLGHLINSENGMINAASGGKMPKLPDGFADRFNKATAAKDDAHLFGTKAELLELLTQQRAGTIRWAQGLSTRDLDQPAPERMRSFAPTIAHLILMVPGHQTMHLGQIQVIRRKLGKPVMF